ncbi:hypothetical protein ACIBTV_31115 [Micromonospora sp. NPDC049366]|uniref:hypothetical protein n=1 Tax=Micromonospora sp. NPDC049366 TaxID=3364271 RepID=UPI0037BC8EF7
MSTVGGVDRLIDSISRARSGDHAELLSSEITDLAAGLYKSALKLGYGGDRYGLDAELAAVLAEYYLARHQLGDADVDLLSGITCLMAAYFADADVLAEDDRRLAEELARQHALSIGATAWSRDVGDMLAAVRETGSVALRNQLITRARIGVGIASAGTVERSALLADLSAGLNDRFFQTGDVDALSEAIEVARTAVRETPHDQLMWSLCRNNLGAGLRVRYETTGAVADLDEAIAVFREVADDPAVSTSNARVGAISNLSVALRQRYELTGDRSDIDEAIRRGRRAVILAEQNPPAQREYRSNLAAALVTRMRSRSGTQDGRRDIDEAVTLYREAVAVPADDMMQDGVDRQRLAIALRYRFQMDGREDDIDEAIALARGLTDHVAPHLRPQELATLAGTLLARLRHGGGDAAVEAEALQVARDALAVTPVGHIGRIMALTTLRDVLRYRWERLRSPADLNEIIDLDRSIVADGPVRGWRLARSLNHLGADLSVRHERSGDPADFDAAAAMHRAAADAAPPGHVEHARALALLALVVHQQSSPAEGDDSPDGDTHATPAFDVTPRDDPSWAYRTFRDSVDLRTRFEQAGDPADLDQAIRLGRRALAAAEATSGITAHILSHLGAAHRTRYEHLGDSGDLDVAVAVGRAAIAVAGTGDTGHAHALSHLSLAYLRQADRTDDLVHLDLAVELGRAAVAAEPQDASDSTRALHLSNLAILLQVRGDADRNVAGFRRNDYREAVDILYQSVELQPRNSANAARYLHNLATARLAVAKLDDSLTASELDEVTDLFRESVTLTAANHPALAGRRWALADALYRRHRVAPDGDRHLAEALQIWQEVATSTLAPVRVRVLAARMWGAVAVRIEDYNASIAAFHTAVGLLPMAASRGLIRSDRESMLEDWTGLASTAAAAALAAERPDDAIELLESGRAVLWQQVMDTSDDIALLAVHEPGLAARLRQLNALLDSEERS